jgi:N-methylhydantoinase B
MDDHKDAVRARPEMEVDPTTVSVIEGALESIATEMGHKLMRMAYSSIIRESEDFGAAIVDEQARQLCEARQSTPLASGPLPGCVEGILNKLKERGEKLCPGDVIMHNDAYGGASHVPDVGFYVPVFLKDELVGFACTMSHVVDIGSYKPGSGGQIYAVDAYAEGLQFKALKVYEQGRKQHQVWHFVRDNIRMSDIVIGDMEAEIAAARIGAERYLKLIENYGLDVVRAACEASFDSAERKMRAAISAVPDGDYTGTVYIDGFPDDPNPAYRDLPISVTLRVRGDALTVDLTGTAPQIPDRPINIPFKGSTDSAILVALKSVLLDSAIHGDVPQNAGLIRPIRIEAPRGCLANPIFPAPTMCRYTGGIALSDATVKALAVAVPDRVCAGIGNGGGMVFGGNDDHGDMWIHVELFEGSYGGRPGMDGMDAVDCLFANTRNNPIEDIEVHSPLRIERYELREGVAAAGKWRGGLGTIKEFTMLTDGSAATESDGHKHAPWGLLGGSDGATRSAILHRHGQKPETLPSKFDFYQYNVKKNDKFIAVGPCGGGYGNPFERDPAAVLRDVLDQLISREKARADYGVVITPNMEIDRSATNKLRCAD